MNKWQLICPGVALVIALIVFLIFGAIHGRNHVRYYVSSMSHAIGTELIEKTNSNRLVKIDSGLQRELASLLGAPTQVSDVLMGDEPGKGGVKASSRLILTNSVGRGLVIRLGPAEQSEGFQVLGYWSFSSEWSEKVCKFGGPDPSVELGRRVWRRWSEGDLLKCFTRVAAQSNGNPGLWPR